MTWTTSTDPRPAQGEARPAAVAAVPGARGFTVLELLFVAGIILLVAAFAFPALLSVFQSGNERKALAETHILAQALQEYRAAYGKWPAQTQDAHDTVYGDGTDAVARQRPALAPLVENPRGIVFVELPELDPPRWLDPWQRPYVMAMDENGDGMVTLSASWPLPASVLVTNVCASVAVFSWGRYPDSPGGRVCSWSP